MHIGLPIHAFFSVSLRACVCRRPAKPKLIFFCSVIHYALQSAEGHLAPLHHICTLLFKNHTA